MNIQEFLNTANEWISKYSSWILVGLTFFLIIFFIVLCIHGRKIKALRKDFFLHVNYHSTAHDSNEEDNEKKEECLCNKCIEDEPTKEVTTLEAKAEYVKPVVVLEPEVTPEQINQEEKDLVEKIKDEDIPEETMSNDEDVIEPEAVEAAEPVTLEPHEEIKEEKVEPTIVHKKNDYYDLPLAKLNAVEAALGLKKSKTKANATLNIKYTLANKKVTKTQVLSALDALSMYHLTAKENKEALISSLIKLLNK